nr:glycosyltransferase family 4 protein [Bacillus pacificus]
EKPTGLFFKEQTVESIIEKIDEFERSYNKFTPSNCRENAIRFSPERFREEIRSIVEEKFKEKFLG